MKWTEMYWIYMKGKEKSFKFVIVCTIKLVKSKCVLMHVRVCSSCGSKRRSTMNGSPPLSSSERRTATGGKARHLRSLSLFLSLRLPVAPSLCLVSRLLTEEPQAAVHSVWVPSSFNERRGEGGFLSAAANRVLLSVCPTVWPSVCLLGFHLQLSNLFSICFFFSHSCFVLLPMPPDYRLLIPIQTAVCNEFSICGKSDHFTQER